MMPFILFGQRMREEIKKNNPGAGSNDIMKIAGQEWNKLDDAAKQ